MLAVTYDESSEVQTEDVWRTGEEGELLEEGGLDKGVGLNTLGLLHGDLQPVAADETRRQLLYTCRGGGGGGEGKGTLRNHCIICTSRKFTAFRMVVRFLALSIRATRW